MLICGSDKSNTLFIDKDALDNILTSVGTPEATSQRLTETNGGIKRTYDHFRGIQTKK